METRKGQRKRGWGGREERKRDRDRAREEGKRADGVARKKHGARERAGESARERTQEGERARESERESGREAMVQQRGSVERGGEGSHAVRRKVGAVPLYNSATLGLEVTVYISIYLYIY